jgi:SAM-dependent methyltransferase
LALDGGEIEGGSANLHCPADGWRGERDEATGVWEMVHSDRPVLQARFLKEYARVRHAEGRGADGDDAIRRLPWAASHDSQAGAWAIRARSYAHLRRRILHHLPPGRRVLDLGAGNGWLSRLLVQDGHRAAAVDLFDDANDGLAAAARVAPPWRYPCIRADFDHLPLVAAGVDLVIFNASLHYSPDPRTSLREALRVLTTDGRIVVLDSPCYRTAQSGRRMVAERRVAYQERYGFASDSLGSREFLVPAEMHAIAAELGLVWRRSRPWLGGRMAVRPLLARLRRRRPPASFPLWVGQRVV